VGQQHFGWHVGPRDDALMGQRQFLNLLNLEILTPRAGRAESRALVSVPTGTVLSMFMLKLILG
jgi:hypothetical protein